MEIFNFFRKFGSNLQNELSGNSVISRNSSRPPRPPPASFLRSSRRVCDRPWLRAGTGSTLRVDSARSWPSYKTQTSSSAFLSFPLFSQRRRLSSGELSSLPQPKPASTKQCSNSVSSFRTHPTNGGCLSPPRTAASDSSSSRPATLPKALFHRG